MRPSPIAVAPGEPVLATDQGLNLEEQLDRLSAQLGEVKRQLVHAQRLASLGTMATMVAHEFNNLLTPIVGYAQSALQAKDAGLMQNALERTLKQVQRAQAICHRLLAQPGDEADRTRESLANLVNEAIEFLVRDLSKDNIQLDLAVPPELFVHVNPALIQQVISNLLLNARQAMLGQQGRLTIWAESLTDGRVWLHVRDTGRGIPQDIQRRIFQPFVTTKSHAELPDQQGIGLGLALCREITEGHGGQITFVSTEGKGTTFSISLPPADKPAPSPAV